MPKKKLFPMKDGMFEFPSWDINYLQKTMISAQKDLARLSPDNRRDLYSNMKKALAGEEWREKYAFKDMFNEKDNPNPFYRIVFNLLATEFKNGEKNEF
jgi:phage-related protein